MAKPRKNPPKPKMVTVVCACGCGVSKEVRAADVARGWGKYASKSCKAKHQSEQSRKETGSGRKGSRRYKGRIEDAPPSVRAEVLIKALAVGSVSFEYFCHVFPNSQKHLLDDHLRKELEDQQLDDELGHPFAAGAFGHGQE